MEQDYRCSFCNRPGCYAVIMSDGGDKAYACGHHLARAVTTMQNQLPECGLSVVDTRIPNPEDEEDDDAIA